MQSPQLNGHKECRGGNTRSDQDPAHVSRINPLKKTKQKNPTNNLKKRQQSPNFWHCLFDWLNLTCSFSDSLKAVLEDNELKDISKSFSSLAPLNIIFDWWQDVRQKAKSNCDHVKLDANKGQRKIQRKASANCLLHLCCTCTAQKQEWRLLSCIRYFFFFNDRE